MLELPLSSALSPELESDVVFGPETTGPGAIVDSGFCAVVGDRPLGFRLRNVFEKASADTRSVLFDSYEVWLIPHRVGIVRRSGMAEPVAIGIEVEYCNNGATCCVVGLLPVAEHVVHGAIGMNAAFRGEISPVGMVSPSSSSGEHENMNLELGPLRFGGTVGANVRFSMSATVSTPRISAVGIGASRCEWRFERAEKPLFGSDLETWATVVLPKQQKQLKYRIRFYMETRTFFFTTRRESDWADLVCELRAK